MAAGVTATIALDIVARLTGTGDLGNPRVDIGPISELIQFAPGTANIGQANVMFSDRRTLSASSSENLDLLGTLTDAFGATVNAAEIVLVYVKAAAGNTNSVIIGNVTNGWPGPLGATGTYTVLPGEYFLAVSRSGWAVTAGTADLLKLANSSSGSSVTYDILILGRTVAA